MVREPYDCIIGDAPIGAIPLGRVATVRGSLRRHAYAEMVEAMMSRRKSSAKPEGLSQLNLNAAGIDVGATSHYVAVPADRAEQPVREFEAFTADLYRLADWLTECGVETVVMESTGVYWIPLFGVLEGRGFEVMLVDPRRIKNVPGRKTDVLDCQWLQQLHTYGLLSGAFRPDGEIRRLRSYLRQRAMLVEYASYQAQVEVPVNQLGDAKVQGQGGRQDQPSIGHQAVVIKGDLDAVGVVAWQHLFGPPGLGSGWCFQNHYPRSTGALSYPFSTPRHSSSRWIGV